MRVPAWYDLSGRDLSVGVLAVTVELLASAFVGIRDAADSFSAGPLPLGRLVVAALVLTVLAKPWRHQLSHGRAFMLFVLAGITWFGANNVALSAGEQQVDAGPRQWSSPWGRSSSRSSQASSSRRASRDRCSSASP